MAESEEERSREELSDEPSPHRLEEMRKKGKVAQSKELTGLFGLVAVGVSLYYMAGTAGLQITGYMQEVFRTDVAAHLNFSDTGVIFSTLIKTAKVLTIIVFPIIAAGFLLSFFGSYAQVGNVFSTEPLNPDFNRLNPVKGIQKYLSLRQLYDGFRLVFRATAVASVAYILVKEEIIDSPRLINADPSALLGRYGEAGLVIFSSLLGVLFVFAGFDLWLQRWEYSKNTRLTKKESKEEHKEQEGDPLIKARIRTVQREIARKRMMADVKKADVVVTNPTHLAIAIKYDKDKMNAPRVLAKGADFIAQKIKKIAADSGIPTVENKPLARTLFKTVKVGQFIPRALYQAVAEVLAYVYKLKRNNFK